MSNDWCTVVTKHFKICLECGRTLLMDGPANRFEAGLDRDGNEIVMEGLRNWLMTPRERRQERLADFLIVLEEFVTDPSDLTEEELKHFQDDLWEIKAGTLRIIFSGGRCNGGNQSRVVKLNERVGEMARENKCCRGLIAFGKSGKSAGRSKRDLAVAIAREDKKR